MSLAKAPPHREQVRAAERQLARRDPALRTFIRRHTPCTLRPRARHFETLVRALVSQQLSRRVADAHIERVYGFRHLPDAEEIERVAARNGWRPYCSVASWYLWRSLDG